MLPAHLRHRDLHRLSDLPRRITRTVGAVRQPGQLPSQIPRDPPVQRRPVHSHPGGHLGNLSAIQDRTDRVQALLDNRQDNQSQSRPPQSDAPAETSHQGDRKQATVADHLAEECRTSIDGGHTLSAATGATLKELMARLGHSSVQAAMIYQHATRDRDRAIARALGELVREVRQEPAEAPEDQQERGEREA
jgi:hypothetical protein